MPNYSYFCSLLHRQLSRVDSQSNYRIVNNKRGCKKLSFFTVPFCMGLGDSLLCQHINLEDCGVCGDEEVGCTEV